MLACRRHWLHMTASARQVDLEPTLKTRISGGLTVL